MKIDEYAEIFKALSHVIRLKIVCGLLEKENCSVNTMTERLDVAQPTVSQHLNILKNAGIIAGYRNGNQICYRLENDVTKRIIEALGEDLCEQ